MMADNLISACRHGPQRGVRATLPSGIQITISITGWRQSSSGKIESDVCISDPAIFATLSSARNGRLAFVVASCAASISQLESVVYAVEDEVEKRVAFRLPVRLVVVVCAEEGREGRVGFLRMGRGCEALELDSRERLDGLEGCVEVVLDGCVEYVLVDAGK